MKQMAQVGIRGTALLLVALSACSATPETTQSSDGEGDDFSGGDDLSGSQASTVFSIAVPQLRDGRAPTLSLTTDDRVYFSTCNDNGFPWETLIDGSWVALRDDRSTFAATGYYLNDRFVEPYALHGGHAGDACSCYQLVQGKSLGPPDEYVHIRDLPAPDAGPGAPPAAVLEHRSVTGPLRARVIYFRDERCQAELQALVVPG